MHIANFLIKRGADNIRTKTKYKFWLEYNGCPLIGEGRYRLLKEIEITKSLKKSADAVGISYKTAYNYIKRIEQRLGRKIIESSKGGKDAGGSTKLTHIGKMLTTRYEKAMERQ
ncbi:MAG: LysR family transcriptional regulator [Candidatus Woesearchaeota archaeon]